MVVVPIITIPSMVPWLTFILHLSLGHWTATLPTPLLEIPMGPLAVSGVLAQTPPKAMPLNALAAMDVPCTYCSFPRGIAGGTWRCPCGAPYCGTLCQARDWPNHKLTCPWREWGHVLRQLVPPPLVRQILAFLAARDAS